MPGCHSNIRGLEILNDWKTSQNLVAKLPDYIIQRWSRVTDYMDDSGMYPDFSKLVNFVEKEARVATNPIASFSAIRSSRLQKINEKPPKAKALKISSNPVKETNKVKLCPYCKGYHYLPNCTTLRDLPAEEKVTFIHETKRCVGCLRTGHK